MTARGNGVASRPQLSCEEVFLRLDDYLDRELSAAEHRLVREHLDACVRCASEFRFEATLVREVRAKLQRLAVPPGLAARIASRLEIEGG